jgi:hypothetical protein
MAILTTSGTANYSASVVTLLNASLRIAQIIGAEETATGDQLQNGMDAFSAMIKGWQASGIHVWCEEECILFPQPMQPLYQLGPASADNACLFNDLTQTTVTVQANTGASAITVANAAPILSGDTIGIQVSSNVNFWTTVNGAPVGNVVTLSATLPAAAPSGSIVFDYTLPLIRPLRVMGGRRYIYSSGIDTPMQMWARLDYQNQPNKYSPGTITAFFYDPQTAGLSGGAYTAQNALLSLWPNPSDNFNGFRFTAQRPIQDNANLANLPDFPVEWNAALKWNLAAEIGPEYGTPTEQMQVIGVQAKRWYDMASGWDRESESVLIGVAWAPGYRRG